MARTSAGLAAGAPSAVIAVLCCLSLAAALDLQVAAGETEAKDPCASLGPDGGVPAECALNLLQAGTVDRQGPVSSLKTVAALASAAPELEWMVRFVAHAASPELRSLWVEMLCFVASLAAIRATVGGGRKDGRLQKHAAAADKAQSRRGAPLQRGLGSPEVLAAAGKPAAAVVEAWRSQQASGASVQIAGLRAAAQALAAAAPEQLVGDIAEYLERPGSAHLARPQTLHLLVDAASQAGRPDLAEALLKELQRRLQVQLDDRCRDALAAGYAAVGDDRKVEELLAQAKSGCSGGKAPSRLLSAALRGFLKGPHVDAATSLVVEMSRQGSELPPKALNELFSVAAGASAVPRVLDRLEEAGVQVGTDCLATALADCAQHEDLDMGLRVEHIARKQSHRLTHGMLESLVKLHARTEDGRAVELFEEMQKEGALLTEGLCGCLLARCADSRNLRLAEAVATLMRDRKMMALPSYKTLMKVYACCGLYDKACDLYEELKAKGLEPDAVMYGCLVKFSVKCGRTSLSEELFEKAGGGYVQNYMWLIRAAGQAGDVARAIQLLRRLQEAQPEGVDVMVYNSVLDACVTNDSAEQAHQLMQEMRQRGLVFNLITYNTLMKLHCSKGDLQSASTLMREMEGAGLVPDCASYNSLISTAVTAGKLTEALRVLGTMDHKGIAPDQYTVSIIMKAARRANSAKEADKALSVLDRPGVDVCEDEVLFNTVLDACIYRHDKARLARALASYSACPKIRPSVRTYGLLIKACSVLRQTQRCWGFWEEMVDQRGLEPNDITLSCMIDALVEGKQVEWAVKLFQKWKPKVSANTVIYSTLIKGFASTGDASGAMAAARDMEAEGIKMNMVAYTALIDAHARNGSMDEAHRLLTRMQKDGCEPNTITYSNVVKGHCVRGDLQEALRVFHEMLQRGLPADTVIINTMLDGCVRHAHFQLADELLEDMKGYHVEPSNFTLSIVVKMWGKRHELDKAFSAVSSALHDGRKVDSLVGACLVGACLHNRSPDRALEALAEIKAHPRLEGPCSNTYSSLVCGLARFGRLEKAVEIVEEACIGPKAVGLGPEPLRQLFRAFQQRGLGAELGQPLSERLAAAGVPGARALAREATDHRQQPSDRQWSRQRG